MAAHEMVSENTAPRGDILAEIKFDILRSEYIDGIKSIEDEAFSVPWSREAFVRELDNPVAVYTVALFDSRVIAYGGMWHILEDQYRRAKRCSRARCRQCAACKNACFRKGKRNGKGHP